MPQILSVLSHAESRLDADVRRRLGSWQALGSRDAPEDPQWNSSSVSPFKAAKSTLTVQFIAFACPVPTCARTFSVFSNLKRHMIVRSDYERIAQVLE